MYIVSSHESLLNWLLRVFAWLCYDNFLIRQIRALCRLLLLITHNTTLLPWFVIFLQLNTVCRLFKVPVLMVSRRLQFYYQQLTVDDSAYSDDRRVRGLRLVWHTGTYDDAHACAHNLPHSTLIRTITSPRSTITNTVLPSKTTTLSSLLITSYVSTSNLHSHIYQC